jgi:hypothetical protein
LHYRIVHRQARKILKNFQNPHFQVVLMIPVSALCPYPEVNNPHFKLKNNPGSFCQFLGLQCSSQIISASSKNNFLANNRPGGGGAVGQIGPQCQLMKTSTMDRKGRREKKH